MRKPIKAISGQLWKSKRKQELAKSDSLEVRRRRAKLLVKQLRRAAKKGKITAVGHLFLPKSLPRQIILISTRAIFFYIR